MPDPTYNLQREIYDISREGTKGSEYIRNIDTSEKSLMRWMPAIEVTVLWVEHVGQMKHFL